MKIKQNPEKFKLTFGEKLILFRNVSIILILALAALVLMIILNFLYKKPDWISIVFSLGFLLFSVLLFLYSYKYIMDIINDEVDIYSGTVTNLYSESGGDSPDSYYVHIGSARHQIGFLHYYKIKENDFITLRKAPLSNVTVSVTIKKDKVAGKS